MQQHKFNFEAIGCPWIFETDRALSRGEKTKLLKRVDLFDQTYSRFRDDSLVSQMSKRADSYDFPADIVPLYALYESLYELSDGKVTPLIGRTLEQLGYDKAYSLVPGLIDKPLPPLDSVISRNGQTLVSEEPFTLDFGAAGKGYLVDILAQMLEGFGLNYTIDASGDIRTRGPIAQQVGLESPFDASQVIGIIELQNASLCGSATTRRKWGNGLHHIVDPSTMEPTQNIIATWVLAGDTLTADGLATALFFSEPQVLHTQFEFEYVRIHADQSVEFSSALQGAVFA